MWSYMNKYPKNGGHILSSLRKTNWPQVLIIWFGNILFSYYNLVEAIRRAPDTFAHLYYYSQLTMTFKGEDGIMRYCRFRTKPGDVEIEESEESGRLTEDEQREVW